MGSKASFLNEALDGVVTWIIDNDSLEVTTSDGFGIPVLKEELVKSVMPLFNNQLKGIIKKQLNQQQTFHFQEVFN